MSHDDVGSQYCLIQDLGVEIEHIPGGCTSWCQPEDIGVNKPFKNCIRQQWEERMIAEGLVNSTTSPPTRENIIEWTQIATNSMPAQKDTKCKEAWPVLLVSASSCTSSKC